MALTVLKKELQEKITGAAIGSPELAKLEAELLDVQTKLSAGGIAGDAPPAILLTLTPALP